MTDEWWNLDQAIAWVMTRDEKIASGLKDGWIFNLISYPDAFGFVETSNPQKLKAFLGDKRDLLSSLRAGKIAASGQCIIRGAYRDERREILLSEWQWLELNLASPPGADRVEAYGEGVDSWKNIRIVISKLKKYFPKTPLPVLQKPDDWELEKIMDMLVSECLKQNKTLNRETLYSEVNARLSKGKVTSEWSRETLKNLPSEIKRLRQRPQTIKSDVI